VKSVKTSEEHKEPKNGHANGAAAAHSARRRFLVVDDDAAFRTRLVKALTARGLEARGAASGEEALAAAPAFAANAAIVDLRMHGMSGLDLVRELTAQLPGIQVLVLTGYGSIATAVEAVRRGAMNYLNKPVDTEQILAAFGREAEHAGAAAAPAEANPVEIPSLARVEWEHIQRVLFDCEGNISLAARRLGLHRRSLQRKLAKLPPLE
jgi:two-component system, response regulator RegA